MAKRNYVKSFNAFARWSPNEEAFLYYAHKDKKINYLLLSALLQRSESSIQQRMSMLRLYVQGAITEGHDFEYAQRALSIYEKVISGQLPDLKANWEAKLSDMSRLPGMITYKTSNTTQLHLPENNAQEEQDRIDKLVVDKVSRLNKGTYYTIVEWLYEHSGDAYQNATQYRASFLSFLRENLL